MKIRLIAPEYQSYAGIKETETISQRKLTLIYLAGLTPSHYEVEICDGDIAPVVIDSTPDLVGISFNSTNAERAYNIADAYRDLGIPVVLGGFHTSLFPDEAALHADAVVIGEAEITWPRLIRDFEENRMQNRYSQPSPCSLSGLPLPRYDLYPKQKYYKQVPLFITRGCPYKCAFCCIRSIYGNTFRKRPVDDIIKHVEFIREHYDDRTPIPLSLSFVDDNIWGDTKYAVELFTRLKPLKVNWYAQGASIKMDDDLIALAAESGCNLLFIGFESLYPENLSYLNKDQNDIDMYRSFIEKMHKNRIAVGGYFITGLPYDPPTVFSDLEAFMNETKIEFPMVMLYTLIPGTEAYQKAEKKYTDYKTMTEALPIHVPQGMTKSDFRRAYLSFYRNIFSTPSIDNRMSYCRNIGIKYINKGHQDFYADPRWDSWAEAN